MMNDGFAFAGANAYRATKIESVKDVFDDLISGYNQLNNKLKKKYRPLLVKAIPV
jgi:hypothetical protein